jgi:hypothetical protein
VKEISGLRNDSEQQLRNRGQATAGTAGQLDNLLVGPEGVTGATPWCAA